MSFYLRPILLLILFTGLLPLKNVCQNKFSGILKKKNGKVWKYSDSAYTCLEEGKYDLSLKYLAESNTLNKNDTLAEYWNKGIKGIVFYRKDSLKKSLKFLTEANNFFVNKKNKTYFDYYAAALFSRFRGRTFSDIGLITSAVKDYLVSVSYCKKIHLKSQIFENYKFIGRAYQKDGIKNDEDFAFIEANYYTALKGFKKLKNFDETAWMYLILSDFYNEAGYPEKAEMYLDSCNFTASVFGIKELIPLTANNYGEIFLSENELKKAERKFKEAISLYKKQGNIKNLQITYSNMSKLYSEKGNKITALNYIDSAIINGKKGNNELYLLNFYLQKKDLLKDLNKDASSLFDEYVKLNNKIIKDKKENLIYAYGEYYRSETLKKENTDLEIKNKQKDEKIFLLTVIIILSVIIFIAFFVLVFLIKRRNEEQLKAKLQDLRLQSVQSRLFPHLLFNTASAAGSVIYKEKREIAYDYLVKMSRLMRKALNDTKHLYKTLKDEIEFTENYLEIQKIRFSERFDYIIDISGNIDLNISVPQMIIQTYVENAVKYAMEPMKKGGLLEVKISDKKESLYITIKDNGEGIEKTKEKSYKGTGSGLKIMNEIYAIHNKNKKADYKIYYKTEDLSRKGERGTLVTIELKFNGNG